MVVSGLTLSLTDCCTAISSIATSVVVHPTSTELWCLLQDSNLRHLPCRGSALPTELNGRHSMNVEWSRDAESNCTGWAWNPSTPLIGSHRQPNGLSRQGKSIAATRILAIPCAQDWGWCRKIFPAAATLKTGAHRGTRTRTPHRYWILSPARLPIPPGGQNAMKTLWGDRWDSNPRIRESQSRALTRLGDGHTKELSEILVGVKGFEPSTPCPPDKCATKLRHTPMKPILCRCHASATPCLVPTGGIEPPVSSLPRRRSAPEPCGRMLNEKLADPPGFEPGNGGVKVRCLEPAWRRAYVWIGLHWSTVSESN
jgi:hypothetical protein